MVAKLINRAMRDGKKSVIEKEVYKAFELIKENSKEYKSISNKIEVEGNFKTREERDLMVGKAIKEAGQRRI